MLCIFHSWFGQRNPVVLCHTDIWRVIGEQRDYAHIAKKGFMSNYLLCHQHRKVQPVVADELDENDNVDRMDDMVADIGRGYDLES
jgi:hypothetical protein